MLAVKRWSGVWNLMPISWLSTVVGAMIFESICMISVAPERKPCEKV